ncbi:MAG: hypothetical protein DRP90_02125 [Planctomycetota bacterium]|nr:MAG: hypothetical protein DRP90_02125 [Planctomycetota bacterium]
MKRIPDWAGGLALSCLVLLAGAWGGRMMIGLDRNARDLVRVRETTADMNARLRAVEERITELGAEVRRLVLRLERPDTAGEEGGRE